MFGGTLMISQSMEPNHKVRLSLPNVANAEMRNRPFTVPYDEMQLRRKLMCFDTNGDGRLSKQELYAAFKSLGSRWPEFRANRALHFADRNGDRYINDDEFDTLVKYLMKLGYTVN